MNVTCPECRSIFRVDPAKLPATSVRARCSVCGGVISILAGADTRSDFAAASAGASARQAAFAGVPAWTGRPARGSGVAGFAYGTPLS